MNYGAVIPSRASEEIVNLHPKLLQSPSPQPGLSLFRMIYKSIILRQNCLLVHIIQIFKYNSIRLSLASSSSLRTNRQQQCPPVLSPMGDPFHFKEKGDLCLERECGNFNFS